MFSISFSSLSIAAFSFTVSPCSGWHVTGWSSPISRHLPRLFFASVSIAFCSSFHLFSIPTFLALGLISSPSGHSGSSHDSHFPSSSVFSAWWIAMYSHLFLLNLSPWNDTNLLQSFTILVICCAVDVNQLLSSIIICPSISGDSSSILYPSPSLISCMYSSQKFMNTTHFIGPPTDPCLTPL